MPTGVFEALDVFLEMAGLGGDPRSVATAWMGAVLGAGLLVLVLLLLLLLVLLKPRRMMLPVVGAGGWAWCLFLSGVTILCLDIWITGWFAIRKSSWYQRDDGCIEVMAEKVD